MMIPSKLEMQKATRLTREGKLDEALAVLRGALAGAQGADPRKSGNPKRAETKALPPIGATPSADTDAPAPRRAPMLDLFGRLGTRGAPTRPADRRAPILPAQAPAGARFEDRVFSNGADSRSYKLYVPSGYDGRALPLVVMLHGCTQSPDDFALGTRMNEVAEERMFFVVYPEQSTAANASKCWNWFNTSDQRRDHGEPSLIAGITREIMQEFSIEAGRVYVAGLSAGGAAAAIMGAAYPDLYAAVGIHSGLACGAAHDVSSAFVAMRQGGRPIKGITHSGHRRFMPTIVFHGDGDKTVHPVNADEVMAQAKAPMNLATIVSEAQTPGGISYTRTIQSDSAGRPMVEKWILHGAGHAWSGGSAAGSFTQPLGPDASREMARFFMKHRVGSDEYAGAKAEQSA
jgi:poly(hydroxyalkanoate) depolymerase family esterase